MYRNTKTYYAIKQAPVSKVFLAKILPVLASNSKFKRNGLFFAPDFAFNWAIFLMALRLKQGKPNVTLPHSQPCDLKIYFPRYYLAH